MTPQSKKIMHVDLDAFFAACEEVKNPKLKGKPLVVGSDPKGGKGRGIVATANYEARKFGIGSAMPISKAYKLCPTANFIRGTKNLYGPTSRRIFARIQAKGFPLFQTGLDEAYLDISVLTNSQAKQLAKTLQKELFQTEKITMSIGIGPNKMIAKIASDFKKPNGITQVKPEEVVDFLSPLEIRKIPGIGPKSAVKLQKLGISRVKDIQKLDLNILTKKFGESYGASLYRRSRGVASADLKPRGKRKSMSKETTFEEDTINRRQINQAIIKLANRLFIKSVEQKFKFKTITLRIRYKGFETHTSQKTIKDKPTLRKVIKILQELLEKYLKTKRPIRLVGVRFS